MSEHPLCSVQAQRCPSMLISYQLTHIPGASQGTRLRRLVSTSCFTIMHPLWPAGTPSAPRVTCIFIPLRLIAQLEYCFESLPTCLASRAEFYTSLLTHCLRECLENRWRIFDWQLVLPFRNHSCLPRYILITDRQPLRRSGAGRSLRQLIPYYTRPRDHRRRGSCPRQREDMEGG